MHGAGQIMDGSGCIALWEALGCELGTWFHVFGLNSICKPV